MSKNDKFGGYEWSWTCGNCGTYHSLSGMMGDAPIINGEKKYQTRSLEANDTIGCSNCDHTVMLKLEDC